MILHPFADFYRGKRVLVTGHTGFTGGWLVAWLKHLNAKISGYSLPPATRPNFFDATVLDRGITSIFGDIRNGEVLTNAFAEFQPEIVIHCAAQSLSERSLRDPVETFTTNVVGTVNLLEEARMSTSVRAVVLTTNSGYECGNSASGDREHVVAGLDPLSASAASAELAMSAYINSFFCQTKTGVASARCANLVGGGDWANAKVIPELVRGIISRQAAVTSRNDSAESHWHVLDAARAYLLLAQRLFESNQTFAGSWDFGFENENTISAQQLAEKFIKLWGEGEFVVDEDKEEDSPPKPLRHLDARKARRLPGCTPALCLDDALAWTVEWYRAFYAEPSSAWRATEDQIERYTKMTAGQHASTTEPERPAT
jgi:CDP-glucose 4,6-dehydratase